MKPYFLIPALAAVLACLDSSDASSAPPRPLKRIAHPSTLGLDILPRRPVSQPPRSNPLRRSAEDDSLRLRHTDVIRLTLRAFDETFHLHLEPNTGLFHPSARINYYSPSGEITRTEPLLASAYKIYEGTVVAPERTQKRWREDAAGGVANSGRKELGWARVIVHDEGNALEGRAPAYEGAFSARGIVHHIQTRENYLRNRRHLDPSIDEDHSASDLVIFRDSDMTADEGARTCSHDSLEHNINPALNNVLAHAATLGDRRMPWYDPRISPASPVDPADLDARFVRRQGNDISGGNITTNFINRIGSHEGCQPTQSLVYMGVAADCEYVTNYGGAANATTQILNDWNSASALYKSTFNVSLGIVELAVQDATCPTTANASTPWNTACSTSITLNDRLSLFSAWRGAKGGGDGAGLWHLMSGCPTGTEIGVAWLGQLCNVQSSGATGEVVSGTGVSTNTLTEWQVVSHEVGHNFGAIHDCAAGCTLTDPCCPSTTTQCSSSSVFIMDAVSTVGENTFSPCSVGNICASMQTMNTTCLVAADTATHVITLQMCGNGIVEQGEDCDPGKGVTSPCCDSATCKFTAGAVCDPKSSDCCLDTCQFAPSSQVCRPAVDPKCDIAESCTGTSSACPADKTTADGTSCGSNGLACASGKCTSLSLQCQTVGASLNLTQACPASNDKSCQVSCKDPSDSQQCIVLQAALVDGSPCGYGGKCESSVCKAGSLWDTIKAWYTQNLQIAIPVTVVAAIVIFLIIWRIFRSIVGCCQRRKSAAYKSNVGRQRLGSWVSPTAGPTMDASNTQYPPMRDAPRTSVRGYVSPGMSYPPSHVPDADDYADNSWQQHHQTGGSYESDPFEDGRGGARAPSVWVDERQYNGANYSSRN